MLYDLYKARVEAGALLHAALAPIPLIDRVY
jgi:hypothetical protein